MNDRPALILVLSELLGTGDNPWFQDASAPTLRRLAERSELFQLTWRGSEAEILGLDPERHELAEGPLAIAAMGIDPPPRSVHFRLSLLSLTQEVPTEIGFEVSPNEIEAIKGLAKRLDTKAFTTVSTSGPEMALVWENGSIDLQTTPPDAVGGRPLNEVLPQGDGEPALRRLVDDSVNMLQEQEFNAIRIEEGLPPLNLLWPWGQGFRLPLPNLALERGRLVHVASDSLRLLGLSRLTGYRHAERSLTGRGTAIRFESMKSWVAGKERAVVWLPEFGRFRAEGSDVMHEQYGWLGRELDGRFLNPIAESESVPRIIVLAPGNPGLGFIFDPDRPAAGRYPFDERAREEPLPRRDLSDVMNELLA